MSRKLGEATTRDGVDAEVMREKLSKQYHIVEAVFVGDVGGDVGVDVEVRGEKDSDVEEGSCWTESGSESEDGRDWSERYCLVDLKIGVGV